MYLLMHGLIRAFTVHVNYTALFPGYAFLGEISPRCYIHIVMNIIYDISRAAMVIRYFLTVDDGTTACRIAPSSTSLLYFFSV